MEGKKVSQLNRRDSAKHRAEIRKGVRNDREQTFHVQNMRFLIFIPL